MSYWYIGEWDPRKPLYVVSKDAALREAEDGDPVWTVSPDPNEDGWNTDCSTFGGGLIKPVAQRLADFWNDHILIENQHGDRPNRKRGT